MELTPVTSTSRANFRRLYADVAWFGLLSGSTMAFLAIFSARAGANSFEISLLTAGPAVVSLLFSLPAGRWLEGRSLVRQTFWSAVFTRLGYLVLVPLPLLFAPRAQVWVIILVTLLMSIPGTLLSISFNAMFAELVPGDWRGDLVGRRNALMAVSQTVTSLVCGQLLDLIQSPLNFFIVFALGAAGAFMSTYYLGQLQEVHPPTARVGRPIGDLARPGLVRFTDTFRLPPGLRFLSRSGGQPLLRLDLLRTSFGPFMAVFLLFYTFQYVPLPLFPLVFVNTLRLSNWAISLGSALFNATVFLASLQMGRATVRFGHRRLMIAGALLYSLYPLLLGLARSPALYWVASLIGGAVWGLTSASLVNRLMERVPEGDRPAYMALHNLTLNLGILLGSFSGPLLGEWMGYQEALLVGAGLRFLAGVLFIFWG